MEVRKQRLVEVEVPERPEFDVVGRKVSKKVVWGIRTLILVTLLLSVPGFISISDAFDSLYDAELELHAAFMEEPRNGEEVIRDLIRLLTNTTSLMAFFLLIAPVAMLIRYGLLMVGAGNGIPTYHQSLKTWSFIFLGLELMTLAVFLVLFTEDWEVIQPKIGWRLQLIPLVILILWLRTEPVKREFQVPFVNVNAPTQLP